MKLTAEHGAGIVGTVGIMGLIGEIPGAREAFDVGEDALPKSIGAGVEMGYQGILSAWVVDLDSLPTSKISVIYTSVESGGGARLRRLVGGRGRQDLGTAAELRRAAPEWTAQL